MDETAPGGTIGNVTSLAAPSLSLYRSWADTVAEFAVEGDHIPGSGNWNLPRALVVDTSESTCDLLIRTLQERGRDDVASISMYDGSPLVPSDYWWILDGPSHGLVDAEPRGPGVVGFIAIRHRLNEQLFELGGHIGYSIRPSQRRRGHATRAVRLALVRCQELGIERALVTCDDDNLASAAIIEASGGVLEDKRESEGTLRRRYWIDVAQSSTR